MGNSAPLQFVNQHFPSQTYQWRPHSIPSDSNFLNSHKFLIDQSTGIIGQKYSIRYFASLQFQLHSFLFRKLNSSSIVTVYDILLGQTPSVIVPDCMVNEHNRSFNVILERIPYRLADIGVIKFQDMTYVLEQTFKGLQALFAHSGKNYLIDEDMICFNMEGKCKIWINQNLFKNTPNINAVFTQQSIIEQIFETLESRLDMPPPEYYIKTKQNNMFSGFTQALNFIQKARKKLHIQTDFIESLRSFQTIKIGESDSAKAFNDGRSKGNISQEKRCEKFSLKNSRNRLGKNSSKPPKTNLSRQQTTQVSIFELQRRNVQQMDMSRFLRSSFKSVSNPQKKKSIQFTEYSEKVKKRISPKKFLKDKAVFNLGAQLHEKFPKGPLFS